MNTAIVAHRGGALLWPENSLGAVRGALALGADGVEVDVHLTKDGHLVVHHDARLGRTVLGQGRIRDLERAALDHLPLVARATERIPTLSDVAALFEGNGALLSVEIKNAATGSPYPRIAETMLDSLSALGGRDRVLVHAFDWRILERLRKTDPDIPTAANISRRSVRRNGGDVLATLRRVRERGFNHANLDHRLLNEEVRDLCRSLGMAITTWTPNREADLLRALDLGVDYIATDVPDLALRMRADRAARLGAHAAG